MFPTGKTLTIDIRMLKYVVWSNTGIFNIWRNMIILFPCPSIWNDTIDVQARIELQHPQIKTATLMT